MSPEQYTMTLMFYGISLGAIWHIFTWLVSKKLNLTTDALTGKFPGA